MRSATTMNLGACVGLKETLAANRLASHHNNDRYPLNDFIGKNFFDGENYRAALERLDGGYEVAMDFIEWMQDYCDNEHDQARHLIAYASKWTNRLKQQSSLVSYHTTKRAQLDVVRTARELAKLKESTCTEIQQVIEKYRNYVNEIYITERFRPSRRHCRTSEFKKSFKTAYASLREIADELDALHIQEKRSREALRTADSACEILELDPTASEKQRARANDVQTRKRSLLEEIEDKIAQTKDKHRSAQKTYRRKAIEIFKQCQYVEEERLEQTRETLLDFIQAMHSPTHSSSLSQIFEGLTNKITTQQNSFDDLVFWAKTYGIENKLTKSFTPNIPLDTDDDDPENENPVEVRAKKKSTPSDGDKPKTNTRDKHLPAAADNADEEEEPSAPISNSLTTPVKTKVKRTKNVSIAEKKNTGNTDQTTHLNNTGLNHM